MKKRIKKIFVLGVAIIMCMGLFAGCGDYGYSFRFEVIGEGGELSAKRTGVETSTNIDSELPSPIFLRGGKNSVYQITFTAIPDDGYKVKEWTFTPYSLLLYSEDLPLVEMLDKLERKVVKDNKSNTLIIDVTEYNFSEHAFFITVEFEQI